MPRSTIKKSRLFREFSQLPDKYVNHNYLKNLRSATNDFLGRNPKLTKSYLYFMLFVYDLEFFTIDWVSEEYRMSRGSVCDRIIYPLMKEGYTRTSISLLLLKPQRITCFERKPSITTV